MSNIINLKKYSDLLKSYYWDCPNCKITNKENLTQCQCGSWCDGTLLYKKVPKELLNILLNSNK